MEELIAKNNNQFLEMNDGATAELIKDLDLSKLPELINEQIDKLGEISDKLEAAKADAKNSLESAKSASEKSAGFGHKKEAIESLQEAVLDNANAQSGTMAVLDLTLELDQKISDISKYLLGLGVYGVAHSRIVIQQLAAELEKDGKEHHLTDIAREQLQSVIAQLQAQGEIREKQQALDSRLDEQQFLIGNIESELDDVEKLDTIQSEKIDDNARNISKHEKMLLKQQEKDSEHDKKLDENETRDSAQDKRITDNTAKINEQQRALIAQQEKNAEQDEAVKQAFIKNTDQDDSIELVKKDLEELKNQVQKQMENISLKTENDKDEIIGLIYDFDSDNQNKFNEIIRRIDDIEGALKKNGWKIAMSVGLAASLLLNLLQIFGII